MTLVMAGVSECIDACSSDNGRMCDAPRPWFVYLLLCRDGSYYAGISTDVAARFAAHVAGKGARYTRSHRPLQVLAQREFAGRSIALRAEHALKQLPKARKLAWFDAPFPGLEAVADTHARLPASLPEPVVMDARDQQFLREGAGQAAALLRSVGNENRLLVLCLLIEHGELAVGQLLEHVPLTPPALSQHLSRMRSEGLIDYRRQAKTLYYRITHPAVAELVTTLKRLYCP